MCGRAARGLDYVVPEGEPPTGRPGSNSSDGCAPRTSSGQSGGQKENKAQESEDRGEGDSPIPHVGLGMYEEELILAREIGALHPNGEERKCAVRSPAC